MSVPGVWQHLPIVKAVHPYDGTPDDAIRIAAWVDNPAKCNWTGYELTVVNRQGEFIARSGDFIVRGIEDEIYPVPEDVFLRSYEQIS